MKQRSYFLLALIFALLAAGAVYLYLDTLEQEMKSDIEYATIFVSRDYIPTRTVITEDMLASKEVPLSQVRSDALQKKEEITGATTTMPLFPGEPFLSEKLVSPGDTKRGLAYIISPGKRAVAVAVNEVIGVGNMVLPGDRVDVIAVLEKVAEDRHTDYATLFVEDLRVLAVGQVLVADQISLAANTVTLEVSPAEAQKLVLAAEKGTIRLLLRGATDTGRAALSPFRLDNF